MIELKNSRDVPADLHRFAAEGYAVTAPLLAASDFNA